MSPGPGCTGKVGLEQELRKGPPPGLVSAQRVGTSSYVCVRRCTQDRPFRHSTWKIEGPSAVFYLVYAREEGELLSGRESLGFPIEATFQKLFIVFGNDFLEMSGAMS